MNLCRLILVQILKYPREAAYLDIFNYDVREIRDHIIFVQI